MGDLADDRRLADVPAPVVARDCAHRERCIGDDRPCERCHELEHAEVGLRAVAAIRAHLDTPERLRRVVHDRDYWRRIAHDHDARATATVGPLHEQHMENAADAKAWAEFYGAILSLHAPIVEPSKPEGA